VIYRFLFIFYFILFFAYFQLAVLGYQHNTLKEPCKSLICDYSVGIVGLTESATRIELVHRRSYGAQVKFDLPRPSLASRRYAYTVMIVHLCVIRCRHCDTHLMRVMSAQCSSMKMHFLP